MRVLCRLADATGGVVTTAELERELRSGTGEPTLSVADAVRELRLALGDDERDSRYLETLAGRGYRLLPRADSETPEPQRPGLWLSFWQELQQRRVFRAAVAYVIVAWALLQVIDIVFPLLGIPDWFMTLTFLAMLAGFPLVLLLAWTLQWEEEGLRYDSPMRRPGPRGFRRLSLAVAVLSTGLFSLLVWQSWEQLRQTEESTAQTEHPEAPAGGIPDNAIAVLRFVNLSDSEQDEYFSDGLSEELLNVLARLRELRVASRTSSWSLPAELDVAEIRDRLQVSYVLEGSVRRNGELVRITAQLIDTSSGYHLWSDTFDRTLADVFHVQDEVAREITSALKILLSEGSRDYLEQTRTASVDAYDAYLRGLAAMRRPLQGDVLDEAQGWFEQANELEPGFAGSWAGLCKVHLARYGFSRALADFQDAETACHRTLTLDETSPGVFEALGELYRKSGQLDKAERNFRSALVLAPNSVAAMLGLGKTLARKGEAEEAENYLLQAVELDPGYWHAHTALGGFYFNRGEAGKAIPMYRRVTLLAPDYVIGHNNLGAAYMLTGDFDRAVQAFDEALALGPDRNAYSNAGTGKYFLREFDAAARRYRSAIELSPEDYVLWGHLGDALEAGNDTDGAREAFQRGAELAEGLRSVDAADPSLQVALARYYGKLGREAAARRILHDLELSANDMYVYYDMSLAYIAVGDTEPALQALQRSLEAGYEPGLIRQDPGFDPLRGEAGFDALLQAAD